MISLSKGNNPKLNFGLVQYDNRYVAELLFDEQTDRIDYSLYIAEYSVSSSMSRICIVNKEKEDLIESRGWSYIALEKHGCFQFEGFDISISIEKDGETFDFELKNDKLDIFSNFANIMLEISSSCRNIEEVKCFIAKYRKFTTD